MGKLYAGAGAIAIIAFLGWNVGQLWLSRASDPFAACRSGNVAGGPIGGPFDLVNQTGRAVTDQQIFAKPALVYFGFASCPDVCPLDNARNVEAATLLAGKGIDVTPVFITVDPMRDTPAALLKYTANFGDTLVGLTGSPEQVKAAAAAFKVYYKLPENTSGQYEVDHTTLTYLMLPKTGFVDFFQRDTTAAEIADRVGCFLKSV
ncbi:MAG: SCO family protein [Alphaproteobacteria bacterium]